MKGIAKQQLFGGLHETSLWFQCRSCCKKMPVTSLELKGVKAEAPTHSSSAGDADVGGVPTRARYQLRRASPDLRRGFRTRYVLQLGRNTQLSNRNHHPHEARRTKYQCFPAPDMCVPHLLSHTKNSFYFFPFGNNKPRFERICFQ